MATTAKKDEFAQIMALGVTQSAANALTFSQVAIGTSIFDYAALLIHRVEYYPTQATLLAELITVNDIAYVAITGSDQIASLEVTQAQVYDQVQFSYWPGGAVSSTIREYPVVHDLSAMPGGGILVPAQSLYIAMSSSGFAAAGVCKARVWYTVQSLKAEQYIELAQSLRVLTNF